MSFTFINLLAMTFDTLLIIPEMVHTIKGVRKINQCKKYITLLDYVFKYASLILMFLPIGINQFGFKSVAGMLIYLFGNGILCLVYDVVFVINVKKDSYSRDFKLLYIMVAIFLISAIILRHWLLLIVAISYAYTHQIVIKSLHDQYNSK